MGIDKLPKLNGVLGMHATRTHSAGIRKLDVPDMPKHVVNIDSRQHGMPMFIVNNSNFHYQLDGSMLNQQFQIESSLYIFAVSIPDAAVCWICVR